MQPFANYLKKPTRLLDALVHHLGCFLSDPTYVKLRYRFQMGRRLDLKHPQSFQEKLQWLKLYDHNPNYVRMVDKVLAKDYAASILGREYVIPLLGVWKRPEDIDWDGLPRQFVLKTNHSGGNTGVVICKDISVFDKEMAIRHLNGSLKSDIYKNLREWPYKGIQKCVFAEQYMEDEGLGELRDYKFFCFNGEVKALFVATDRQNKGDELKFDFFDADYNHLPIRQGHPNSLVPPQKPYSFNEMKELAAKLSKGIPHVRVDFYEVNGRPFFGELTFCHFGGMVPFEPEEWDYTFGKWLNINELIDETGSLSY